MINRQFCVAHRWSLGVVTVLCFVLLPLHMDAQELTTFGTPHFTVKRSRGVQEADARKVGELLEQEYASIGEKLNIPLPAKIDVYLYDSVGKFLTIVPGTRAWRGAITARSAIHVQPVQELEKRKILNQALSYELAGVALDSVRKKGCPRWLSESFAVYVSGELTDLTPPIGTRMAAFSDLNQDMQTFQNPPRLSGVHYLLGQTMAFLIQKYGDQKAYKIFKGFDGTTGVDRVFKNTFDEDYAAIEKSWARYIAFKTAPSR